MEERHEMKGSNCYRASTNPQSLIQREKRERERERETMRAGGIERTMEWLRPFVKSKAFDYCVVWKLGDDPSRFFEWLDCCCGGGYGNVNVKEEKTGTEHHVSSLCRDVHTRHTRRTKACEALASFPSSMSLYSGIHGEVIISNQPRWPTLANALDSAPSDEDQVGTQVLIPVIGGLIELFVAKHIPKDKEIIEFIIAHCNFDSEQEAMTVQSSNDLSLSAPHNGLDGHLLNRPPLVPLDSSTGSTQYHDNLSKQQMGLSLVCGKQRVVDEDNVKVIKGRSKWQSKHTHVERNRRNRIRDLLFALRTLVPNISKMDRISIIGDAIEYIEELQNKVKELQEELKEMDDDDDAFNKKSNADLQISKRGIRNSPPTTDHNKGFSTVGEKKQMKVQLEVNQVGEKDFLVKFICEHKRGGFSRLIEVMNSLGLQVVDANVTTFNGKVLNILNVKANRAVQLKMLKDSLIKLTC